MNNELMLAAELAWNLDDSQLYALLDADASDFQQGQLTVQRKLQKGLSLQTIVEDSKDKFSRLWQQVKNITCQVYSENIDLGGKDLVTVIVAAITAALGWTGVWVVALVTLAVRHGLDLLCQI